MKFCRILKEKEPSTKRFRGAFAAATIMLAAFLLPAPASAVEEDLVYRGHRYDRFALGNGDHSAFHAGGRQSTGRRVAVGYGETRPLWAADPLNQAVAHEDFLIMGFDTTGEPDSSFAPCESPIFGVCPAPAMARINIRQGNNFLGQTVKSDDRALAVAIDPQDRVVVVGTSTLFGNTMGAIIRLNADGSLDATFGNRGIVLVASPHGGDSSLAAVAIQPDGRILAAGSHQTRTPEDSAFLLTRVVDDGGFDPFFWRAGPGVASINFAQGSIPSRDEAVAILIRPDKKIVVVGTSHHGYYDQHFHQTADYALALLRENGFETGELAQFPQGKFREDIAERSGGQYSYDVATDALLLDDNSIVITGQVTQPGRTGVAHVAKFDQFGRYQDINLSGVAGEIHPANRVSIATAISQHPHGEILVAVNAGGIKQNEHNLNPLAGVQITPDLEIKEIYRSDNPGQWANATNDVFALPDGEVVLVGSAYPADRDELRAALWQPLYSFCGNGILEEGEQCEAPFGACCDSFCRFSSPKQQCRPSLDECVEDAFCSGESAICPQAPFAAEGTLCGDGAEGQCTAADTCDGLGHCVDNNQPAGTACGDAAGECQLGDVCNGDGICVEGAFEPQGTACGDPDALECNAPDTCDGTGSCEARLDPVGTPCGNDSSTECTLPDSCNENGSCEENHLAHGSACGDAGNECVLADFCDGDGACTDPGMAPAGTQAPEFCNDGSSCTADLCNGAGGCDNSRATDEFNVDIDGNGEIDNDGDGIFDACDSCVNLCNADQADTDGDCPAVPGGAECGDACDACPAIDEDNQDPRCNDLAGLGENAAIGCCIPEGSVAAAVDEFGGQCEMPDDVEVTSPDGQVTIRIPQGAVDEETTISATRTTKGGRQHTLRGTNRHVSAVTFAPPGQDFNPPLQIVFRWEDSENRQDQEAPLDVMDPGNRPGRDWMCHQGDGWSDRSDTSYRVAESNMVLVHRENAEDEEEERGVFSPQCGNALCGEIGADGWPSDWGDENQNRRTDDDTLRFCCDLCRNQVFFETRHFSEYAIGKATCAEAQKPRVIATLSDRISRDKVRIQGSFDLAQANIDRLAPDENGMVITVTSARGEIVLQDTISGSATNAGQNGRWRTNRSRTSFRFSGARANWKVSLKEKRGQVRFALKGDRLDLDELGPEDLPLETEVRFTTDTAPVLEQDCTDLRFEAARQSCELSRDGMGVSCR
ncbi:MAG: hypothetical protein P8K76_16165 [Candidatus Binatia bacterium]|nr:hypothetical protein [Candidatus Binatia bacterium]MDG1956977.1 hypothetical protein [Candidatus Binatia bacterium]MDG2011295.1 hypothetical protein [Candidatus Binatia bacterium]